MKKNMLLLVILFVSCLKSKESVKIKNADWLLGQWKSKWQNGTLSESWKKVNDSVFIGESYFVKENDTLHSEKMQLKQKGENLIYVSTIKGQNENKPVLFVQNTEVENQFVFENSAIQYPRKIGYKLFGKDQMTIQVSGVQFGKPCLDTYTMSKK